MLIYCPKCEHACLDGDDTCPRCGHALKYKVEKIDNLIDQTAAQPRSAATELAEALQAARAQAQIPTPPRLFKEIQPGYSDWISRLFITIGKIVGILGVVSVGLAGMLGMVVAIGGLPVLAFANLLFVSACALILVMHGGMLIMAGRAYELLHDIAANTRQLLTKS